MRKSIVAGTLAAAADLVMVPLSFLFVPIAKVVLLLGPRAHWTRGVLDKAGIGLMAHHYYQPMTLASDLRVASSVERDLPGLDLNEKTQLDLIGCFTFRDELESIPEAPVPNGYHYNNRSFGSGDGEMLYNMIRHFKPRMFVEIGCGFSTRLAHVAIQKNMVLDPSASCDHILIEPFEQPWLETLGLQVMRQKVEEVEPAFFQSLGAGDILFIDSSHVIRPQGDVVFEYLTILGRLAPGVIVHAHDIFTPRDYPEEWILTRRYMWDEQYLLEAFLSFNADFEILSAVNWLAHNHADKLKEATPVMLKQGDREPGSFWFRRKPAAVV